MSGCQAFVVMSLKLYLSVVGLATCVFWWILGYLFLPNTKAAPLGPILGLMIAARVYPRAKEVPKGYRRSLLDYGSSNAIVVMVWITLFLVTIAVGAG
jgi:hypothetical protein